MKWLRWIAKTFYVIALDEVLYKRQGASAPMKGGSRDGNV